MTIRPASPHESASLIRLASEAVREPYELAAVAHEKLFGPGFAGAPSVLVEADDDTIRGLAVRCGRWCRLLAVHPDHRGRGAGSALLAAIEDEARAAGERKLVIAAEPGNYFTPGVLSGSAAASFLEHRGYTRRDGATNLEASLEQPYPPPAGPVRRPEKSERELVLEWVAKHFGAMWAFEIRSSFDREDPSIFIAESEGAITGFSAHDANNRGLGSYGPAGVLPEIRGKGLGRLLLHASLWDMQQLGFRSIVIPWVSSVEFYERSCGARVAHQFDVMEKPFA